MNARNFRCGSKREFVWFIDKNCDDKIISDGYQRGELFSNDKKERRKLANMLLRFMPSVRTARYGFMITRGSFGEDEKSVRVARGAPANSFICFSTLWRSRHDFCTKKAFYPKCRFYQILSCYPKSLPQIKCEEKWLRGISGPVRHSDKSWLIEERSERYLFINSIFRYFRALLRLFS